MPILSIIIVIKDQMVQINIPESYKKNSKSYLGFIIEHNFVKSDICLQIP
jgi:hypothetical protein